MKLMRSDVLSRGFLAGSGFLRYVLYLSIPELRMREHHYYVYILTRERNSVFYTGVTNDLVRRVYEHKTGDVKGFTKRYNVKQLVYYEYFDEIESAITREKVIKKWKRRYKIYAIEKLNPMWKDLYYELTGLPEVAKKTG